MHTCAATTLTICVEFKSCSYLARTLFKANRFRGLSVPLPHAMGHASWGTHNKLRVHVLFAPEIGNGVLPTRLWFAPPNGHRHEHVIKSKHNIVLLILRNNWFRHAHLSYELANTRSQRSSTAEVELVTLRYVNPNASFDKPIPL